jgi:homoserine O-acetyltransferase
MKKLKLFIFLFVFVNIVFYAQGVQQFAEIGDLVLENGQKVLDCKIGYRTFGKLNEDKSNIIIFLSYFNGTSQATSHSLGEGKLVDTTKFYVIAFDALGNGISTSPNNSQKQSLNNFPQFTIGDMVKSQYIALTKNLNINHIYCVMGGSMGSMQAYEWVVAYPDFMDKAIPYVPTPYLTAIDKMLWSISLEVIKIGENYNVPDKDINKILNLMINFTARTPKEFNKLVDVNKFDEYLARFDHDASTIFPPICWKYQLISMINHDITRNFNHDKEATGKHVKAEILSIVASQDHILNPASAMEFAKYSKGRLYVLDNDGGHQAVGNEMETVGKVIDEFLKK